MKAPQQLPLFDLSRVPRVSPAQLRALHSLLRSYALHVSHQHAHRVLPMAPDLLSAEHGMGEADRFLRCEPLAASPDLTRDQRLAVASKIIKREIGSFTELSSGEAATLIDAMKKALGQKTRPARKRPDRDQAQAYGTAGRRDDSTKEIRLIDDRTLSLIDSLVEQLGWTQERFQQFLASTHSPVASVKLRTLAEGNRVIWALRGMIRRQERSNERRRAR